MIPTELSHSPLSENSLLGTFLLYPETVAECQTEPEEFYNPVYETIYRSIRHLADTGMPFDVILVHSELERVGKSKETGGIEALLNFAESATVPSNAKHLANMVRERYLTRKYAHILKEAEEIIISGTPIDDACKIVKECLEHLHTKAPGKTKARIGRLGTFGARDRRGVSTGYPKLDGLIGHVGGYPASQMTMVSAYHKTGKTALMLTSAVKAAQEGRRPLFASFADMDGPELEDRVMKGETGWSRCPDYGRNKDDWLKIYDEFKEGNSRMDIYDAAELSSGYDVETFIDWLEPRQKRDPYTEIYVDYAQELRLRNSKGMNGDERAAECASLLQRAAKRYGIPIIVGSQITEGKGDEKDKTKGSRSWEEKAGLVIRLRKTGKTALLEIPYSRVGHCGDDARLNLRWNPERVRFEE